VGVGVVVGVGVAGVVVVVVCLCCVVGGVVFFVGCFFVSIDVWGVGEVDVIRETYPLLKHYFYYFFIVSKLFSKYFIYIEFFFGVVKYILTTLCFDVFLGFFSTYFYRVMSSYICLKELMWG